MKNFDVMAFVDNDIRAEQQDTIGCYVDAIPFKEPAGSSAPDWFTWRTQSGSDVVFASKGSVLDSVETNVLRSKYK